MGEAEKRTCEWTKTIQLFVEHIPAIQYEKPNTYAFVHC